MNLNLVKEEHKKLNDEEVLKLLVECKRQATNEAKEGKYNYSTLMGDIISLHKIAVERKLIKDD